MTAFSVKQHLLKPGGLHSKCCIFRESFLEPGQRIYMLLSLRRTRVHFLKIHRISRGKPAN